MVKKPTVSELLDEGRRVIGDKVEAEFLLGHILKVKRSFLILESKSTPDSEAVGLYRNLIQKRKKGVPSAYLTGEACFMGMKFTVTPATFIPRPETEIMVEKCMEYIDGMKKKPSVVELGAGSGNIAVALAKLKGAEVTALEKSPSALKVARRNAQIHKVENRVNFIQGDMFSDEDIIKSKFDILISNPPYVSETDYEALSNEVRREPAGALKAGNSGMSFIKGILSRSGRYVKRGGRIFIEIGYDQGEAVIRYARQMKNLSKPFLVKDYSGIDRVFISEVGPQ